MTGREPDRPDGWHPWPMTDSHVLRDALYVGGLAVATVEAFGDNGPYYPNAITPRGERVRGGPHYELAVAIAWAEEAAGHRARRARP